LKRHRQSGSVLNWKDRRTDLYEVRYNVATSGTARTDETGGPDFR
jgi:hypothetical protein